jgi:phosphate transport system protein
MRSRFDMQLEKLSADLIEMGGMIEDSIEACSQGLVEQNVEMAQKSIALHDLIDEKEREIETMCLKLLLQQQPVARDLRMISAALKMITDMERIGDQCQDISEIVIFLSKEDYIKKIEHIPQMAGETIRMVTLAIDAFVTQDLELAKSVIDMDDTVDDLFLIIKNELVEAIGRNPANGGQALDLLMIAKYFERIGDHAVNIAEWVAFSMTGIHPEGT